MILERTGSNGEEDLWYCYEKAPPPRSLSFWRIKGQCPVMPPFFVVPDQSLDQYRR